MARLSPAIAATRVAVRRCLVSHDVDVHGLVMVACSGGADSLALASAASFFASSGGPRCGLITVDHGLQSGSADRAAYIAEWAGNAGFAPVLVHTVDATSHPGGSGPEATARTARYAALIDGAKTTQAQAVLLGHTRNDQAETVLLALARGSGLRGLAGMPQRRTIQDVVFLRPFLDVTRDQTQRACSALGLTPWDDPHNSDPTYSRARVRAALPLLGDLLGGGVVSNLARTARMAARDMEYLDKAAVDVEETVRTPDGSLCVIALTQLPVALRHRVLHHWALDLGVSGAALSFTHIEELDRLVTAWSGQGPVWLPGGIQVMRRSGRLRLT